MRDSSDSLTSSASASPSPGCGLRPSSTRPRTAISRPSSSSATQPSRTAPCGRPPLTGAGALAGSPATGEGGATGVGRRDAPGAAVRRGLAAGFCGGGPAWAGPACAGPAGAEAGRDVTGLRRGGRGRSTMTTAATARSCQPCWRGLMNTETRSRSSPSPVTARAANTSQRRNTRPHPTGRPSKNPTSCSLSSRIPGEAARTASCCQQTAAQASPRTTPNTSSATAVPPVPRRETRTSTTATAGTTESMTNARKRRPSGPTRTPGGQPGVLGGGRRS